MRQLVCRRTACSRFSNEDKVQSAACTAPAYQGMGISLCSDCAGIDTVSIGEDSYAHVNEESESLCRFRGLRRLKQSDDGTQLLTSFPNAPDYEAPSLEFRTIWNAVLEPAHILATKVTLFMLAPQPLLIISSVLLRALFFLFWKQNLSISTSINWWLAHANLVCECPAVCSIMRRRKL
jgi:hypothetical protein